MRSAITRAKARPTVSSNKHASGGTRIYGSTPATSRWAPELLVPRRVNILTIRHQIPTGSPTMAKIKIANKGFALNGAGGGI
jgi:hypothetical protein